MPTLNEIINRLKAVRSVMKTGDVDFAVCVGGEDGFTTTNLNVTDPLRLEATGKPCAVIVCWKDVPGRLPLMDLVAYRGEPCGVDGYPNEVLSPLPHFSIPMDVALTTDKKIMLLVDSVDHYQIKSLSKAEAMALSDQFRLLAEAMEP